MHKSPLVSIITLTFNSKAFLEKCILSVLTQDYPQIDYIILDNQSTDGTKELLQSYQQKYPEKIRFISEPDQGPGDAWNKGISMAKGEILGWLGSDDTYKPGTIKTIVNFFLQTSQSFFVFGSANFVNEHDKILRIVKSHPISVDSLVKNGQMPITPACFYKKEIFKTIGPFDKLGNDYDFMIRVAKNFQIYTIEQTLCNFRIHSLSQTSGDNPCKRKMWLKEWCRTSRCHGGGLFTSYCMRYYIFCVLGCFLPIWNYIFFLISRIKTKFENAS